MISFRYVARAFLVASVSAVIGMSGLILLIDFADRAKIYTGPGWLLAVAELYACKFAMTVYQIAPAAAGLAAAVAISSLRQRGEITALRSLGRGPGAFAWPVAACATLLAITLSVLEDPVVVPANYRAEEITTGRFNRWGDWATYHRHRQWFRSQDGSTIFRLGRLDGSGFADVTLLELDDTFRLQRRIDARRLEPIAGGAWRFEQPVIRAFDTNGRMAEARRVELVQTFEDDLGLFRLRTGRPSQLRRDELPEQVALRKKLGLPHREWELALHERRAYQVTGIPTALLGMALALRPRRRGHLTAALAEGLGVTIVLWSLSVLSNTLTLAEHLSPIVGGWLPLGVATAAAAFALRKLA